MPTSTRIITNSPLSRDIASSLFFKFNPRAITNGNSTHGGLSLWHGALKGDEDSIAKLLDNTNHESDFHINRTQLDAILTWLEHFESLYIYHHDNPVPPGDTSSDYTIYADIGFIFHPITFINMFVLVIGIIYHIKRKQLIQPSK